MLFTLLIFAICVLTKNWSRKSCASRNDVTASGVIFKKTAKGDDRSAVAVLVIKGKNNYGCKIIQT